MTLRMQCICVDCTDPVSLGRWWAEMLGWRLTHQEPDQVVLEPPAGSPQDGVSPDLVFLRVPDPKSGKSRLHIDLRPDDQLAEVARALEMGASPVDIGQTGEESWTVLADPEGNEFCILRALTKEEIARAESG